jgi:hypothetical protein
MKRAIAAVTLAAMAALAVPAAPALANGAASTRNILLGIGAAAYLVIQHNRKVHEKYAEDARRQAELQSENNDAWAAYSSEKRANDQLIAEISDLKREVGYQHDVILAQRHRVATTVSHPRPVAKRRRQVSFRAQKHSVAMVSYGWGQL